ncbi:MAG: FtsX-like permease family protein, partial [Cyclobacteriaceae bacterium]|nr:FtsX-like permease family protein [Cyclobacteriaceae bacterium]
EAKNLGHNIENIRKKCALIDSDFNDKILVNFCEVYNYILGNEFFRYDTTKEEIEDKKEWSINYHHNPAIVIPLIDQIFFDTIIKISHKTDFVDKKTKKSLILLSMKIPSILTKEMYSDLNFWVEQKKLPQIQLEYLKNIIIDNNKHYFKLLNLEIIAGRGFTENEIGSWDAVIVSDSYVRQQGWKDDPLQHKICYGGACEGVPVIGVVRDASFWGLQKSERPMLYYPLYGIPQKMIIRLTSIDDVKVEEIKSLWQKTVQRPFEFQLLDQYLAKHLTKERKMVKQISWLSAIAVLLIIMALLGMIHVQLIRNKKSTAVRKVFGARITDLLRLTWRSHLLLFLIACVFAYPLVHTIMQYWLEQFTLKTTISLMTFIKSIIPLVIIIFFAMLYHSWKLGRMKPLDTIRYE